MRALARSLPHTLRQKSTLQALQRAARQGHTIPRLALSRAAGPRGGRPGYSELALHRLQKRVASGARPYSNRGGGGARNGERAHELAFHERVSVWLSENTPKGFGNFFPKGGAPKGGGGGRRGPKAAEGEAAAETKAAEGKAGEKAGEGAGERAGKTAGEKAAGSGGAKKKPKFSLGGGAKPKGKKSADGGPEMPGGPDAGRAALTIGLAAMLLSNLLSNDSKGREISWQEFKTKMLETGEVDRVLIVNKQFAKVLTHAPFGADRMAGGAGAGGANEWGDAAPGSEFVEQGGVDGGAKAAGGGGRYPRIGSGGPSVSEFYFNIGSLDDFERKLEEAQREIGIAPRDFVPVQYVSETNWLAEGAKLAPTLLILGVMVAMMKGSMGGGMGGGGGGMGNIFKVGKSNATKVDKESISVTFKDVAGVDEAKREIMEFVEFLKKPEQFTNLGAKIPKGAILVGPPGTGKTLLARATAGEADVPFFTVSGSDFIEMFVGVGPSRVRDLFKDARANAPCIIFIDEIDAVARQRSKGGSMGGNDERENTLNQLLVEMDGFNSTEGIVVLAGTNRIDILDSAILRPGRFDRQITVDKPDIKGRKEVLLVHLKGLKVEGDVDEIAGKVASLTPGFSGADLANIANEAAIIAARQAKESIQLVDFESASDRVIGGLETGKAISKEERRTVAYHEAGHAIAGWNLEHADPLLKVTIVPRGKGSLGFAQYLPKDVALHTKEQLIDMVCMALGGRAAEELHFGKITTGASDDLRRVTQIIYQMISVYGMNDRVGQLSFPKDEGAMIPDKMYSDKTAELIDEEAKKMVDELYTRTKELLASKEEQVVLLGEALLEHETINHDAIVDLIGNRPYDSHDGYKEFVQNAFQRAEDAAKQAAYDAAQEAKKVVEDVVDVVKEKDGDAPGGGATLASTKVE